MAVLRTVKISHDLGLTDSARSRSVHQAQTFANQFDPKRVTLVKFLREGQATITVMAGGHEAYKEAFPTVKELCTFVEGYNTALSSRNPFKKWSNN